MPRRRRDRDGEPFEREDAIEEQPVVEPEGEAEAEEWPEWAYEDVPRRRRSRRSKRLRRSRRERREGGERPAAEEAPEVAAAEEPHVWVAEPAAGEDERRPPPRADDLADGLEDRGPPTGAEEADPDVTPQPEPVVVVEAAAESTSEYPEDEEPTGEPMYDSRTPERAAATGEEADEDYPYSAYDDQALEGDDPYDYEREAAASYQPVIGDVVPGGVGPRRAALHERKRKQRRALLAGGAAVLLLGVVLFSTLSGGDPSDVRDGDPDPSEIAAGQDQVETMLLYGTSEDAEADGASWVSLLSIDRGRDRGSVVYIPAHTAVEVPGRGLLPLGESVIGSDVPLLLSSTEALLGIEIDRYLELSERDAQVLFEGLGPLEVDVPGEVSVPAGSGQTRLLFTEGVQEISGERFSQLLFVVGVDGDDVELGNRHLAFWDSLFTSYGGRPDELEAQVLDAAGVLSESDASAQENAQFLSELAALPEEEIVLNTLPVQQVTVGDDELYSVNEEELAQFVAETIGAGSSRGTETRVQILNGNGVPGIGDDVAELLVGEGFRVILSGNAQTLDYEETLIVVYERTDEALALAQRAKELLGVGEVQVSGQDQGIVDLTIVVGKDFLGRT